MPDMKEAACHLVEVCLFIRRDHNTDDFMRNLCEALNGVCEAIGEGDGVGYVHGDGRFVALSGVKWRSTDV